MEETFKRRLLAIAFAVLIGAMLIVMVVAMLVADDGGASGANANMPVVEGGLIPDPTPVRDSPYALPEQASRPTPQLLVELRWNSLQTSVKNLVKANNAFAVKLYKQLSKEESVQGKSGPKSFCFSPYSIATLLQAIKVGTRGETEEELAEAMCLTSQGEMLDVEYRALLNLLDPPSAKLKADYYLRGKSTELAIANHLWIQEKERAQVLPRFTQILSEYYDCGFAEVDFRNHQNAASTINHWVAEKTRGRIHQVIQSGDIEDPTFFAAVNAVYFRGHWEDTFDAEETRDQPFYDSDGKKLLGQVPMMMSKSDEMSEAALVDGISVLRKPYCSRASFVVLLPPPGKGELEKLEASLSVKNLAKWLGQTKSIDLKRLELPKFELEDTFSLIDVMKQLGVVELFDGREADFSGMIAKDSPWWPIWIYLLRHKATIQVDEAGTVATAATIGAACGCAAPFESGCFIANRPFLFLVFDQETSSILFMGRYMGPEKNATGLWGGFF